MSKAKKKAAPSVVIAMHVIRSIRQHARSSVKAEVCGVLIGKEEGAHVIVESCIQGVNAAQGGAHVTFTQETWEHIYQIKDREYPDERIVGWYHSHPAFGIFLSDHDIFIQKNFFNALSQIAWVYDPVSDEEGCFGWVDGEIERLSQITVRDTEDRRASNASIREDSAQNWSDQWDMNDHGRSAEKDVSAWAHWTTYALTHILALSLGFAAAMYMWRARTDEAFTIGYITGARDLSHGTLQIPKGVNPEDLGITIDRYGSPNGLQTPPQGTVGSEPPKQQPEKRK